MATATQAELQELPGDGSPLEMFDRAAWELGNRPLLRPFESTISAAETLRLVDTLAAGLAALGVRRGDRIALYLQNDPQFVVALLATWRLGAVAVPCNPMLRERELAHHFTDAGVTVLIALDDLYESAGGRATAGTGILTITTGRHDLAPDRPGSRCRPEGADHDLLDLLDVHAGAATTFAPVSADDLAVITYTSGTTGPPKGSMSTHGNVAYASRIYRDTLEVTADDTILGIAPLYHVTGLTGHIGLALASGASLVLAHRFDAAEAARLTARHSATVTIAAITAYVAIANDERVRTHDMTSLRLTYSGGAPIAPATVASIRDATGIVVRPVYGLTETTGPTHLCPPTLTAPVHPETGALSVGLAVPGTRVRVVGEDGQALPAGEIGEVAVSGPQVVAGYWQRPQETATALPGGELRTGDVGVVDEQGWLYLVDRRKDMIIASGFKVWPREVEDVLYEHDAVREAAVIGVDDAYRGETVWAYVSLKAGHTVEDDELVQHCRERLAAYKYPRAVHVLDELPKTASGKILRRDLRDRAENHQA